MYISVYTASLHTDIAHAEKKEDFDKRYKKYNCVREYCGNSFYSMKALKKHRDRFHKEDKYSLSLYGITYGIGKRSLKENRTCMQCGKIIVNEEDFKDHLEGHTKGNRLFKCDICDKEFEFRSKLKIHVSKHIDEPDICPHCGVKLLSQKVQVSLSFPPCNEFMCL